MAGSSTRSVCECVCVCVWGGGGGGGGEAMSHPGSTTALLTTAFCSHKWPLHACTLIGLVAIYIKDQDDDNNIANLKIPLHYKGLGVCRLMQDYQG